jgi:hypothetical protein
MDTRFRDTYHHRSFPIARTGGVHKLGFPRASLHGWEDMVLSREEEEWICNRGQQGGAAATYRDDILTVCGKMDTQSVIASRAAGGVVCVCVCVVLCCVVLWVCVYALSLSLSLYKHLTYISSQGDCLLSLNGEYVATRDFDPFSFTLQLRQTAR